MYFLCDSIPYSRIKTWYSLYSIGFIHSNPFSFAEYVEQTGRQFKTQIIEHKNHINRNTMTCLVTEYRINHNQNFNWDDLKIIGGTILK